MVEWYRYCLIDEDFVTNLKVRWWSPMFIGRHGVSLLHIRDVRAELSVWFVKVNCIVSGSCGGNTLFGMYGEVRMIVFIGVEG